MLNTQIQENLNNWSELCPLTSEQLKSIEIINQYDSLNDNFELNEAHANQKETIELTSLDKLNEDINELLYNFDIDDLEDLKLKAYVENLKNYKKKCDCIHETITNTFEFLNILQDNYTQVSLKTNSLHNACEQILNDQTKLVNTGDLVGNKLSYFTEVDVLVQKLNSPLMENNYEYIIPILSRIDECMNFFNNNVNFWFSFLSLGSLIV